MNYTSIEQSKELLKLGLNPESADMFYSRRTIRVEFGPTYSITKDREFHPHFKNEVEFYDYPDEVPCWSVGALIKILPHDIVVSMPVMKEPLHCHLNLSKTGVGYCSSFNEYTDRSFNTCWTENPDLVDALFNCVVWLLENKHI